MRTEPLVVALVSAVLMTPVLIAAVVRAISVELALQRGLVVVALSWAGVAVLGVLVKMTSPTVGNDAGAEDQDPATRPRLP